MSTILGAKLILAVLAARQSGWVVAGSILVFGLGLFVVACADGGAPARQPSPTRTEEIVSPTPRATSTPAAFETPPTFAEIGSGAACVLEVHPPIWP